MFFWMSAAALAGTASPTEAVEAFVAAGDRRDLPALEQILHEEFRVVARMPDGISFMPRALYLGLVRDEKIGGTPRQTTLGAVMPSGDLATVKGSLSSATADFDCTWTLAKTDAGWQVVQDVVVYTPKAG